MDAAVLGSEEQQLVSLHVHLCVQSFVWQP